MLKSLTNRAGRALAPRAGEIAPGPVARLLHEALARAVSGVGPLDGAAEVAAAVRAKADGDVAKAVDAVISHHVKLAGGQGFLTNLGGLVTLAATIPANISGLALLQCRMVAAIAALNGHDLADDGVRNAILACILGEDAVKDLVRRKRLPGTPREMAAATADHPTDPAAAKAGTGRTELDRVVSAQVAGSLVTSVLGKRAASSLGKRVPVVGGLVGAGTDAWATRQVGKYASRELAPSR